MENNSADSSIEPEEFEVERLVGHRIVKAKVKKTKGKTIEPNSKFEYLLKWLNYDDTDNTWEKEDNVYAIDMIVQYWRAIPSDDKDRILFETIQATKKDPIRLSSPPPPKVAKVAKVIAASSPSPPTSPILAPSSPTTQVSILPSITSFFTKKESNVIRVPTTVASSSATTIDKGSQPKQQTKISDAYKTATDDTTKSRKGKEKEGGLPNAKDDTPTSDLEPSTTAAIVESSSSDSDSEADNSEDDASIELHLVKEPRKAKAVPATSNISDTSGDDLSTKRQTRSGSQKRTRSGYTDYFTEEHNRKKKRTDVSRRSLRNTGDAEDEIESVASSVEEDFPKKKVLNGTDEIVYNESFGKNAAIDWESLAEKVEYIGREVEGGPIYCAIKWKDSVRTFHSIDLVREKRPDLVIDAFLELVYP